MRRQRAKHVACAGGREGAPVAWHRITPNAPPAAPYPHDPPADTTLAITFNDNQAITHLMRFLRGQKANNRLMRPSVPKDLTTEGSWCQTGG